MTCGSGDRAPTIASPTAPRAALGGGILLDAIHELDYLLWLLGPVASVSAELDRVSDLEIDVEDTALLSLRFASGLSAPST